MGPKWRRTFLVLATAAVVALGIQSVRKGLRAQGFDLHSYLEAAAKALAGATPYGFEDVYFPYLYPPFTPSMVPLIG